MAFLGNSPSLLTAVNAGQTVSGRRLVDYVWGYTDGDVALLKTHICHIRKKLRLPLDGVGAIRAVPRVGYRLIVDAVHWPLSG